MNTPRCVIVIALLWAVLVLCGCTRAGAGERVFVVRVDDATAPEMVSGRVIVCVVASDAKVPKGTAALDAPFWDDVQPVYGRSVSRQARSEPIMVDDRADALSVKPSELSPGMYRAAARLVMRAETSSWRRDAGNLYSDEVAFTVPARDGAMREPMVVTIRLTKHTEERVWPTDNAAVALVEIRSELLSKFHGRPVMLRAGVVLPLDYDPARKYAAIYNVPGFGGDHFGAIGAAQKRAALRENRTPEASDARALAAATFEIVLDPESPNGHTLFANSENNGPCAAALVNELIPALEAQFPLQARPEARLLRGHSSGGWSTLWLALTCPDTFGATWSTSPDPIDFHCFQCADIYADANMYESAPEPGAPAGTFTPTPSFRRDGKVIMTARVENANERIVGPDQTSGQQWASWMAVWGPRVGPRGWGKGHPAALFDSRTGRMDHEVAMRYRAYDIGHMLSSKPDVYAPLVRGRVRLIVGDADNFYLERAVIRVRDAIDKLSAAAPQKNAGGERQLIAGYIKVLPGLDHGTLFRAPELAAFPAEMLAHLGAYGLLQKAAP